MYYSFNAEDIELINRYRTPETRLAFALQLCVLRFPGRVLRRGDVLPLHLLAFIAEQVGVSPDVIGSFARRRQTQYEHLAELKRQFDFSDLTSALKGQLKQRLAPIALKTTDGYAVLVALIAEMRQRRIIVPGISVVERMAAEVMHLAEITAMRMINEQLLPAQRVSMDAILSEKTHRQQSVLSWLRENNGKVSKSGFFEVMEKLAKVRSVGLATVDLPPELGTRIQQMLREGLRFTAQAFQQMGPAPRAAIISLIAFASLISVGSASDLPIGKPIAKRNVLAIPPPTTSWSTLPARDFRMVNLVETFDPATMATMGRFGVLSAAPRASSSAASSGPAQAIGANLAMPWVVASALCAVPNASLA